MLTIRPAEIEDAPAIARVDVDTWRSTYSGIIPQNYLESLTVQNRTINWVRLLERGGSDLVTLVSEDHDRRVVGFVSSGPMRHRDVRFEAEIASLYILRTHQRGGHGRRLFLAASNRLAGAGLRGLFAWVLADSPSRSFYESLGGELVSETIRTFAGKPLRELGYGWGDMPTYV